MCSYRLHKPAKVLRYGLHQNKTLNDESEKQIGL